MTIQYQTFGYRLKYLRNLKKISQFDLAEASGVSRGIIAKMESDGIETPSTDPIKSLAKCLGSTPEFIMFGIESSDKFRADVRTAALSLQRLPEEQSIERLEMLTRLTSGNLYELIKKLEEKSDATRNKLISAFIDITSA